MVFANPLACFRKLWSKQETANVPFPALKLTTIYDVPVEVRIQIWKCLGPKEYKALRLVCSTLDFDITQFMGIYAELTGPKPEKEWTLVDKINVFRFGNLEPKRFEDNCLGIWKTSNLVQSQSFRRLATIPENCMFVVQGNSKVRRIAIQLDENIQTNGKLSLLLAGYLNIRVIHVSWKVAPVATVLTSTVNATTEYGRNAALQMLEQIIKAFRYLRALKDVCIVLDMPLRKEHVMDTFVGVLNDPTVDQALDYTTTLCKLKLVFPIFRHADKAKISWWTVLMNRQTQLRRLTFDLGFVYWSTFQQALENNAQTLEELDLTLGNYVAPRTHPEHWNRNIPMAHRFDWRVMLRSSHRLKALRVTLSPRQWDIEQTPHKTRNFIQLSLLRLQTLELEWIHLSNANFKKIFSRMPCLKKVKLFNWNDRNLGGRKRTEAALLALSPIFQALIRSSMLEEVEVRDSCLAGCPRALRNMFRALPNYKIIDPWVELGPIDLAFKDGLLITRKPTNQLRMFILA